MRATPTFAGMSEPCWRTSVVCPKALVKRPDQMGSSLDRVEILPTKPVRGRTSPSSDAH